MVRIGGYVGRGQVISTVVCIAVQTNVARGAPRAGTAVEQYMTSVQPNLLWSSCLCGPGVWRKSGKAVNGGVEPCWVFHAPQGQDGQEFTWKIGHRLEVLGCLLEDLSKILVAFNPIAPF